MLKLRRNQISFSIYFKGFDIRNPFFTRKIKKLNKKVLELKTCNFWLKIRNF